MKSIFINGPISSNFIGESIQKHSSKTGIGAHQIFLGQIREDIKENRKIIGIEYSAYEKMVMEKVEIIRENIISQYQLQCLHIYHSLGIIKPGEICLFVFTSSTHRKMAQKSCEELVEIVKNELPIWGKEVWNNDQISWKLNS